MAVSKRLRYEILRRDNHACRYCGASAPDATLEVDHVVPVALGGTDDPSNLVTSCADCNSGKATSAATERVVQDVDQDTLRWADALRRAADLEQAATAERADLFAEFYEHWTSMNNRWAWPPAGWEETLTKFLAAGLSLADLKDATDRAASSYGVTQRNRWRYFCGICWRRIEERQEAARAILAAEDEEPG